MAAEPNPPPRSADERPEIRVLTADDVAALRFHGPGRLSAAAVRNLIEDYPGRSVWLPATLEYALLAPWRHRDEIAVVQELAAVRHAEAILACAVERCRLAGAALMLVIEMDETRRPAFYERCALKPLEEVITYELDRPRAVPFVPRLLTFERLMPSDPASLDQLVRIDNAAFPWLWWNSAAEFLAYGETPGVQLFLGRRAGRPVAYVGITTFAGWGHLDRMAVVPEAQGMGLGREALAFAVNVLARQGARRVGLSTQGGNLRSQRLYEGFGFRRSPGYDYRLIGAVLRPPAPGLTIVEESRSRSVKE